jgi:hypothetical protein
MPRFVGCEGARCLGLSAGCSGGGLGYSASAIDGGNLGLKGIPN